MSKSKKKYYAVIKGFKPGIYGKWYGEDGAEIQVKSFANSIYKGFESFEEAQSWLDSFAGKAAKHRRPTPRSSSAVTDFKVEGNAADITIYTDGGALGNPGPGGYAAVVIMGKKASEISEGYRLTTNNRMELMACIAALESVKINQSVTLYSDSKYVVDAIEKGWAKKWQANNWMRNKSDPAKNSDLWKSLLDLCDHRSILFKWVRGHANNPGNERCDELVKRAAMSNNLQVDEVFEKENEKCKTDMQKDI